MARRISEETIIQINEVYLECGVKSKTAQIVGVSPSTVTKYLIPNYQSQRSTAAPPPFEGELAGVEPFISSIISIVDSQNLLPAAAFCKACELTDDERKEMKEIQKGVMI